MRTLLRTTLVALPLALCSTLPTGCAPGGAEGIGTFSEGMRAGHVVKLSRKGSLAKTWEGQLALGFGLGGIGRDGKGGTVVTSTLWSFSVAGDGAEAVVEDLERALRSGERVVLHYRQARVKGLTDTDYDVERVEFPGE